MNASENILPMRKDIRLPANSRCEPVRHQEPALPETPTAPTWGYIIATLGQYKYWILLLSLLSALGAGLFASLQQPLYRGAATLLIETSENKLTDIEGVYGLDTKRSTFLETQFALLRSRNIALRSMEQLDLDAYPEYSFESWEKSHPSGANQNPVQHLIQTIANTVGLHTNSASTAEASLDSGADSANWRRWQLAKFRKRIAISPITNTQLVEIRFDSTSSQLSADAANAIANAYINMQLLTAASATTTARSALSEQLEKLKQDLLSSETSLQNFREQNGLVGLSGGVTVLAEEKIQQLASKQLNLQTKLASLEESLGLVKKANNRSSRLLVIPIIRNDAVVKQKDEEVNKARQETKALRNKYFDGHPDLTVAEEKLQNAIAERKSAIAAVVSSLRNQHDSVSANIAKLNTETGDANTQLESIQAHQVKLKSLERAVEENRSLFNSFFKRLRETDAIDGLDATPGARVVDPAVIPERPIKPSIPMAIIAGGILGALLTISWVILQVLRSRNILDISQARKLPVQFLGSLPKIKSRKASGELANSCLNPNDIFAEQVQIIATDLKLRLNQSQKDSHKLVFVTSAVESQGKTTVSASLAISYAQMGLKVLLIDSDKRMQQLASRLKINHRQAGFTDFLSKRKTLSTCIQQGPLNNLHVMGFGRVDPIILHRIAQNGHLNASLNNLKEHYDLIIVDSAPLAVTAETREFISYTDALIFVSTPETSALNSLKMELDKLQEWSKAPKYLVLNKFDDNKTMKYGDYGKTARYYA